MNLNSPVRDIAVPHTKLVRQRITKIIVLAGVAGYEPGDGRPKVQNWLNSVKELTNPHYDEAHKSVYKLSGQASIEGNAVPKYFTG